MNIVKETDISAPPDRVFGYLLDFPRHSEWTTPGHKVRITPESSGSAVVGSAFNSEGHQFGRQRDRLSIVELIPNRRIVYEAKMKDGNTFRHTLDMRPLSGGGTRLSKRFESLQLNLISKLTQPLAWIVAPKLVAGDVQRIKENVEQTTIA